MLRATYETTLAELLTTARNHTVLMQMYWIMVTVIS